MGNINDMAQLFERLQDDASLRAQFAQNPVKTVESAGVALDDADRGILENFANVPEDQLLLRVSASVL